MSTDRNQNTRHELKVTKNHVARVAIGRELVHREHLNLVPFVSLKIGSIMSLQYLRDARPALPRDFETDHY